MITGKFIAAMDHSGGSTGGVLERYGVEYTGDNKMDLVHEMRLRMVNSPDFTRDNIWAAILYKDTIDRGMVTILKNKGIEAICKIDSGCEEDGTLKDFDVDAMIQYSVTNSCYGTKMRSIVKTENIIIPLLKQQFELAKEIASIGLVPIIEPEVPIDHPNKANIETWLLEYLKVQLKDFNSHCILKLTLPEVPNLYKELNSEWVKLVGLSGGYTTKEACRRLGANVNVSASFSRALSQGLRYDLTDDEFNTVISKNIKMITEVSA